MRVEGSGVQGSGFRVQGSGFRVQGSGFRGSGFRVQGSGAVRGSRVQDSSVECTVHLAEFDGQAAGCEDACTSGRTLHQSWPGNPPSIYFDSTNLQMRDTNTCYWLIFLSKTSLERITIVIQCHQNKQSVEQLSSSITKIIEPVCKKTACSV